MGPANPTHTVHLPAVPEPMVTSPIEGVSGVRRFTHEPGVNRTHLSRFSTLNISQVAGYLGYPRIHEFSRVTGQSPSASRALRARERC